MCMTMTFHISQRKVIFTCVLLVVLVFVSCMHRHSPHTSLPMVPMVPVSWKYAPFTHLHLLYTSVQNFEVDNTTQNVSTDILVHVAGIQTAEYINQTYAIIKNRAKQLSDVDNNFLPLMTTQDRINMLNMLDVFIQICDWSNITYFLIGGTLLGSYRHHGFIPWDDDIDIAVNASDWRKIRHVLSNIPGYSLFSPSLHQWKFYNDDFADFDPPTNFKWPNIDIFFFTEDSTYIWGLTDGFLQHFFNKKSEVFPLQLRPFENMVAAVPCNTPIILQQEFNMDTCATLSYNHRLNIAGVNVNMRLCRDLHSAYPFVFRKQDRKLGLTTETLKVADETIHELILPDFCTPI